MEVTYPRVKRNRWQRNDDTYNLKTKIKRIENIYLLLVLKIVGSLLIKFSKNVIWILNATKSCDILETKEPILHSTSSTV